MHKKRLLLPSQLDSATPSGLYKISRNSAARLKITMIDQAADDAAWDGFAACVARTNSPVPAPHFENTLSATVNGTSTGWTRSGGKIYTAPAIGVGTEGTSTVKEPFSSSSTIRAGTSASSISASAGAGEQEWAGSYGAPKDD
jgi:hypothetical protein